MFHRAPWRISVTIEIFVLFTLTNNVMWVIRGFYCVSEVTKFFAVALTRNLNWEFTIFSSRSFRVTEVLWLLLFRGCGGIPKSRFSCLWVIDSTNIAFLFLWEYSINSFDDWILYIRNDYVCNLVIFHVLIISSSSWT